MNFSELATFIKADGCLLRLYKRKSLLKVAQCLGTFDISKKKNPIISLATKGHGQLTLIRTLLHEYAHYRQHKEGYFDTVEGVVKGWEVLDKWLNGRRYDEKTLAMARNCVVLIEYDAEIRTIQLARTLGVDIGDVGDYLDDAHSYASHLKNVFRTRVWSPYRRLDIQRRKLSPTEILATLTEEELKLLE